MKTKVSEVISYEESCKKEADKTPVKQVTYRGTLEKGKIQRKIQKAPDLNGEALRRHWQEKEDGVRPSRVRKMKLDHERPHVEKMFSLLGQGNSDGKIIPGPFEKWKNGRGLFKIKEI